MGDDSGAEGASDAAMAGEGKGVMMMMVIVMVNFATTAA